MRGALCLCAAGVALCFFGAEAWARPSLGGAGASGGRLGNVGGGGGASIGGGSGMNRPSGNISRPNVNRPSAGNISRPSAPNITRPSPPNVTRPGGGPGNIGSGNIGSGSSRPTRPNLPERPNVGGGVGNIGGNRPSVRPPTTLPPVNRPDLGGITRPGITPPTIDRPSIDRPNLGGIRPGDRPSLGEIGRPTLPTRPSLPDRPTTLPGRPDLGANRPELPTRPERPERPVLPGRPDRPGIAVPLPEPLPERPERPIDRPIIGGPDRPGIGDRWPDRPIIGDRPDWIQRPIHPDRPIIGGPNRPWDNNWDNNWNSNWNNGWTNWGVHRPGWNNQWNSWWHWRWVNSRHHWWHNGCWNLHWHNHWHTPIIWTGIGWSIGPRWNAWGIGPVFVNPHFVSTSGGFDYSQPIVINNVVNADATATATVTNEQEAALNLFDEGVKLFQAGRAEPALGKFNAALQELPGDPVLHEVKALALFALGRFQESAAVLSSLLAVAPGMDWTSMSNLYGDVDDYTRQLRALEEHIRQNPSDASAMFVLAYHYLVIGQNDSAVKMLREVVRLKPNDITAKRMLEALDPPEETPAEEPPAEDGPTTDLVGKWKSDDGKIQFTVDEQSQFTWKATPPGKPAAELSGDLIASNETIALETKDEGALVGRVRSGGADQFTLILQGMAAGDPGIVFNRQK